MQILAVHDQRLQLAPSHPPPNSPSTRRHTHHPFTALDTVVAPVSKHAVDKEKPWFCTVLAADVFSRVLDATRRAASEDEVTRGPPGGKAAASSLMLC
jgi:hypothetical protein